MTEANSSGRAAPKSRSIDVHVNLLSQRVADRARIVRVAKRKMLAIGLVVLASAASLPLIYAEASAATAEAVKAQKVAASVKTALTKARESAKLVEPRIQGREMLDNSRKFAHAFFDQLVNILNAPSDRVAIAGIRAEVLGGDLKISARADAEDFAAADEFLARARGDALPEDVGFNWTRRSDLLRVGGTSFELVKKVALAP